MPVAGIVTLIGVGLIVAALAVYLITVAFLLRRVSFNVGTVIAGLRAIALQAESLGQRLGRVNSNLQSARSTLHQSVEQVQRQLAAPPPRPAAPQQMASPAADADGDDTTGRRVTGRKSTGRKSTGRKATGRKASRS